MMRSLLARRRGFTLIELLVVIVILALLMAIAIPAYLSQQKKAKASKTQQYLATAYKSARAELVSNGGSSGYPSANAISTLLRQDQPQLTFKVGASTLANTANPDEIVIGTNSTSNTLYLYAKSGSGDKWRLIGNQTGSGAGNAVPSNQGAPPTGYSVAVLADSPLGYWRLADSTDSSGSSYTGTPTNVTYGPAGGAALLPTDGNNVATFNGTNSMLDAGDINAMDFTGTTPFSIEAWARPDATTVASASGRTIAGKLTAGNGFDLEMDSGGIHFQRCVGGTCWDTAYAVSLTAGNWYHIVGTYDGSTMIIIVNNVRRFLTASITNPMINTVAGVRIGGRGTNFFSGDIDEVAVYGSVLTCGAASNGATCNGGTQVSNHYLAR